jgi:transcriptional regulator with XRE-family HTH domain
VQVVSDQPGALRRNLRRLREAAGLSQELLAVQAGVTSSTVQRIEGDDDYQPRLSSLSAIARALGVRTVDLLADPEPKPEPNGDTKPEARAS